MKDRLAAAIELSLATRIAIQHNVLLPKRWFFIRDTNLKPCLLRRCTITYPLAKPCICIFEYEPT